MTTTLTREALREKGKPHYEEVDVPGWGRVGIRSCGEVKRCQRQIQYADSEDAGSCHRVHTLIDQLMISEDEPMFEATDEQWLSELDSYKLDGLVAVVVAFNERNEKKESDESSD